MSRAAILLATLLSVGAVAQQTTQQTTQQPTPQPMGTDPEGNQIQTFTELDTNSDGILEESEVSAGNFSGEFQDLDMDGDGEVNRNEYYQYYREQGSQNR